MNGMPLQCQHWLADLEGISMNLDCEREDGHKGKHRRTVLGSAVGPRPRGGKPRKHVTITVEWSR